MIRKPVYRPAAGVLLGVVSLYLSLSCVSLALAAEPLLLAESVVTATRTEQATVAIASSSVITREDIERQQPRDVPELLRSLAGVNVWSNGGRGKATTVSLRGTHDKHLLVLVDGIKIGSATSGSAALQNIPVEQIERIEVVRGPRSSLYGSEAMGGVIQIFTRQARDVGLKPGFAVSAGSRSTYRGSAGLQGGNGPGWFSLGLVSESTDGINARSFRPAAPAAYEPDADGFREHSASLRGGYRFAGGLELDGSWLQSENRSEFDSRNTRGTSGFDAYSEGDLQVLGLRARFAPLAAWKVTLQGGHSEDRSENFQDDRLYSRFDTLRDSLAWQNDIHLGAGQLLSLGLDYQRDRIDTTSRYVEDSRFNRGVFAQYQARFGRHGLQAALRHDRDEFFGGHDTGSLAWRYALSDALSLSASYGTAFRAPTFNDLYYPASASTAGNPDVQPETSQSYELGLEGSQSWGEWSLHAFENQIDDLIEWQGRNPMRPTNISSARIRGLEAVAGTELWGWQLSGNLTLLDPRDRSQENHGHLLPRRAKRSLNLDLERRFGAFGVGAGVFANSYRFDAEENSDDQRLPGYALVDLRADYHLSAECKAQVKVSNLFDRDYQTAQTYEQPGRALLFSVRYQAL